MQDGKVAIVPLGDRTMLVRFGDTLSDGANRRAVAFARQLSDSPIAGVAEIVPSLVSVQLRLEQGVSFRWLASELSLRVETAGEAPEGQRHQVALAYDGEDLAEVAALCQMSVTDFVAAHEASVPRVLAVGFAPGFVYCGFHEPHLVVPRRQQVRASVPAGTILFAAGQTAITSTPIRTGWHIIGQTPFRNFDPAAMPPTVLRPGDSVAFVRA